MTGQIIKEAAEGKARRCGEGRNESWARVAGPMTRPRREDGVDSVGREGQEGQGVGHARSSRRGRSRTGTDGRADPAGAGTRRPGRR